MRRCGFFLEVFGLSMPDYLQCEIFPESTDTDVCLGNREVKEARFRAAKPSKKDFSFNLYVKLSKWCSGQLQMQQFYI